MKADVYSFGVMLWEMVSGEVPYDGMKLQDVCGSICRGEHPAPRPDFDARLPGICALMERCWELRPSARPDCGQLMAELAEIQDVLDLRSVPSPPPLLTSTVPVSVRCVGVPDSRYDNSAEFVAQAHNRRTSEKYYFLSW